MNSRDYLSHSASTIYDQDDDLAEEHVGLATFGLRVLTILFGLCILLPLALFSPVVLVVCAIFSQDKDQPVVETSGDQAGSTYHRPRVIPATVEEFGVELIAG